MRPAVQHQPPPVGEAYPRPGRIAPGGAERQAYSVDVASPGISAMIRLAELAVQGHVTS
jgi:hypothetical protein